MIVHSQVQVVEVLLLGERARPVVTDGYTPYHDLLTAVPPLGQTIFTFLCAAVKLFRSFSIAVREEPPALSDTRTSFNDKPRG